jgi:hypothetical protein
VEKICGEFNTVNLSSMLWALAAMGRVPAQQAMRLIERRLEEIRGDLTSSELANTLWAFATFFFLGKKPGDQLLGLLERRAEEISVSGDFDSPVLSLSQITCFTSTKVQILTKLSGPSALSLRTLLVQKYTY